MSIQTLPPPFRLSDAEIGALLRWWTRIADPAASGIDKADRAVLRRCASPEAVSCTAAYHRAFHALKTEHDGPEWSMRHCDRLAVLIGLAAHVKSSAGGPLPQRMGQLQEPGGSPRVSELRFKRLLESPDLDSLFTGLRRVLPLVSHEVDLRLLASDLFAWGETTRKRWAYAYFDPSPAAADPAA